MLRMGRNPKGDDKDATADHTPASSSTSAYGNSSSSAAGTTGGSSSSSSSGSTGGGSSTSDSLYQGASASPNNSRAVTESESLARDIKEGTLSGFVGNGTMLTGEASFKGMLRVDGHLSGRVTSQDGTLIVSTNGQVDANVEVSVAQIYGTVNGDITATKRIEMGRVARVTGNIQTPALVIENGALFEGSCRMMQPKEVAEKRGKEETAETTSSASSYKDSGSTSSRDSSSTSSSSRDSSTGTSSKTSDASGVSSLSADAASAS